jgi:mitochondrial import receptor subunit TOM40
MNQGWTANNVTKLQAQVSIFFLSNPYQTMANGVQQFSTQVGHNMLQIEHDYQGTDYNLNAKAINMWPTDLSGIYIGSYLQSFSKNLALGIEGFYQRPTPDMAELSTSYLAKYTGDNNDWIATAQLQPSGILHTTYWQKLSEKVEVAAELQVIAAPTRRDAVATLGAKYDLRMSTFRAQVDSLGKVSALLEQRFAPTLAFLLSGEIDHSKVCVFLIRFVSVLILCLSEHSKNWSSRDD